MIRLSSDNQSNIVSVERIYEYTQLPTERDQIVVGNRPNKEWPDKGGIVFDRVCMRYRPGLEPVLNCFSAEILPKEKIGIVGRTGSGKSSLLLTILRLIEYEAGSIYIDGVNLQEIGLYDLRSKVSVIPQEAILFSGTVRFNLDPFDNFEDKDIWEALEVDLHLTVDDQLEVICD